MRGVAMPDAGWYADTEDPAKARWFDGTSWTDHRVAMADHAGPPPPPVWEAVDRPAEPANKRSWKPPLLLVPVVLAAAAIGFYLTRGGGQSSETYTDPSFLAVALNKAGFDCSGYQDLTSTSSTVSLGLPEYRSASGECPYNGKSLRLDTFADSRHLNAYLAEANGLSCVVGKAFGITEFNIAYGSDWTVTYSDNLDRDIPRQVATALHGRTFHKVC